jgi:hypothetical protein
MINRLRKIACASVFPFPLEMAPYTQTYTYTHTEKGINRKRQLPFVCCKQLMEMTNFHLFAANRKGKFVFLGQQMIKGNQQLLFQEMYPSKDLDSIHMY